MNRVTVNVTQECIDAAIQRDDANCAIAIAVRMLDPEMIGWVHVKDDDGTITFSVRNERLHYEIPMPSRAARWVTAFDQVGGKEQSTPFNFILDPNADGARITEMKTTPPDAERKPRTPGASTREANQRPLPVVG